MPVAACRATLIAAAATLSCLASVAADENRWRKLPPLPGRADHISAIGLDGDTLWAVASTSVAWWDGSQWRIAKGTQLRGGMYLAQLRGGGSRPLLLSQTGQRENWGNVYRLRDGEARFVTEFHYDVSYQPPGLALTTGQQILNFSKKRLRVFRDGNWAEAKAPEGDPLIFETGDSVYCYYPAARKLFQISSKEIAEKDMSVGFQPPMARVKAALWGADRVLMFQYGRPGVKAFHLKTGEATDVASINDAITDPVYDVFRTRDGSVWLLIRIQGLRKYTLARVSPDGECSVYERLARDDWDNQQFLQSPDSVLEAQDGALWLGGRGNVLTRIDGNEMTRFGPETGYALTDCLQLIEDRHGNLYAASPDGIYVYFAASEPPASLPPPPKSVASGPPNWTYTDQRHSKLAAAWKIGPTIFATTNRDITGKGRSLVAIAADTGELRYRVDLDPYAARFTIAPPWVMGTTEDGIVEISIAGKIVRVRADNGQLVDSLVIPHDERIAPLPTGRGYLVVPGNRSQELAAVDPQNETFWRTALPGEAVMHPSREGNLVVVQTGGSQQTVCLDAEKGTLLWQEQTDAHGRGVSFFDDTRFVVEAHQLLSPQFTEAWLICRDPQTGRRRWHFQLEGFINHPPLVDRRTGRVYGVLTRGGVICLRGEDGSVVWEDRLSESAIGSGGASLHEPAWCPHSLDGDRLLVVDRALVLHVLSPRSGEALLRVSLEQTTSLLGGLPQLIAPPWIADGSLIVAFADRLVSYPLPADGTVAGPK